MVRLVLLEDHEQVGKHCPELCAHFLEIGLTMPTADASLCNVLFPGATAVPKDEDAELKKKRKKRKPKKHPIYT